MSETYEDNDASYYEDIDGYADREALTAPPIVILIDEDGGYSIIDGLRRITAARIRDDTHIEAYVAYEDERRRSSSPVEDKIKGFAHMTFPGIVYELILNAPEDQIGIFGEKTFGWTNRIFLGTPESIGYFAGTFDFRSRLRLSSQFGREMGPIVTLIFYLSSAQIKEAGIHHDTGEPYAEKTMSLAWATAASKYEYLKAVIAYLDESNH